VVPQPLHRESAHRPVLRRQCRQSLQALLDAGYDARGIDATQEMLGQAKTNYPALSTRLTCDTLPTLASIADDFHDGLLCWAVLMHLLEEFLFDTVSNLRRVLKSGGRLLISTPLDGPTTDPDTQRDSDGRIFNGVTPENFHFLIPFS
jgi:SAM-dependent methyltransferase